MSDQMFSDGSAASYAELPVKVAYLRWTRGDAKLRNSIKSDPALFFGGWRAGVKNRDGEDLPALPLPIVERVSEDGQHVYNSYATNVLEFLPIQHRTRFELREKVKDPATGKENIVIRATAKEKRQGYTPVRQVFGLVFVGEDFAPAVLYVDKWSTFISFERTGQQWQKVQVPDGMALVRRYGSVGEKSKEGAITPKFEVYGEARSTPIEAIDTANPRFVKITPHMVELFNKSKAWKDCSRWNAEGESGEVIGESPKQRFLKVCAEMKLSNIDIEQILKENGNNYAEALKAVEANHVWDENEINTALAETDQPF